jgi:LCP family protein required for cell wall assembly
MQSQRPPYGPRRSAFAAAFFSFLIPGLGHAYQGRWGRALLWAAPWVLALSLVGGLAFSMGFREFGTSFLAPSWLQGVLVALVIDLLYRLASLLDAYRLAQVPLALDAPARRVGSVAGLVAILLVLVISHVAVARPVFEAYEAVEGLGQGADDPLESIDADFLRSLGAELPSFGDDPTLRPGETATPTPEPTPTPTKGPDWDRKGRLNVLLIGADGGRAGYAGYLTDTMMTVSIDPRTKEVAFISLPRDTTRVPLPRSWAAYRAFGGAYDGKINSLYTIARGNPSLFPGNDRQRGYNALKGALSELYGIDIKYYVAVDLQGFRDAIQTLGGVMIDVQVPVYDASYPSDDGRGIVKLYIPPGFRYMNGKEALSYARARHATNDFDRAARQQRVVTSVRDQTELSSLLAPGVIGKLLRQFRRSVRTDVPPELLPAMVQLISEVDLNDRVSLVLSPPTYTSTCYPCPPSGLYELIPNIPAIRRGIANLFTGDRKAEMRRQRIEAEGAVVHVLNGTTSPNSKATAISEYLAQEGISAVVPPVNAGHADRNDYARTVITVYNGAAEDLEETVERLKQIFKVAIVRADDPAQEADIVVIVGTNTPVLRAT